MYATDTEWANSGPWYWLRYCQAKKSIITFKQQLRYLSSLTSEYAIRWNDYRSEMRQIIQTRGLRPWKTCLTASDMTIYFLLWLLHALYMEIQVNVRGRTLGKTHKHNSVIMIHDHQVPSSAIHGIHIGTIYPQGCLCFCCDSNVKCPPYVPVFQPLVPGWALLGCGTLGGGASPEEVDPWDWALRLHSLRPISWSLSAFWKWR